MLYHLLIMSPLLHCGSTACIPARRLLHSPKESNEVFVEEEAANKFFGRHLLFNRFDFEIFTPGNLERECIEEVCNYEEAREVFENIPQTDAFWKKYTEEHSSRPSRVDVTALLIGLLVAGLSLLIIGLVIWFLCQRRCKGNRTRSPYGAHRQRGNASMITRGPEEISLHTIDLPTEHTSQPGLPTYEQAMTNTGPHDGPPPPYPGSRPGSEHR